MKFTFTTLDVFTSTRYAGNPLAIVMVKSSSVPSSSPILTEIQKQAIAGQFNLSETVFLYGGDDGATILEGRVKIDIFTPYCELPFAGHPTIGAAWFMLHCEPKATEQLSSQLSSPSKSITGSPAVDLAVTPAPSTRAGKEAKTGEMALQFSLLTKAGAIPIQPLHSQPGFVTAQIPHDIHIHAHIMPTPPHLIDSSFNSSQPHSHPSQNPVVSIVKGVSFILATASLVPDSQIAAGLLDEEWKRGIVCTLFYVDVGEGASENEQGWKEKEEYRTRMWDESEDPATGSASCALAAYLALQTHGKGRNPGDKARAEGEKITQYSYTFTQGVEMGQKSEIGVEVVFSEDGVVKSIFLSGTAVKVMEGELEI